MWHNSMHKAPVQSEFIPSKRLYVNRKPLNWNPDFHIKQNPKLELPHKITWIVINLSLLQLLCAWCVSCMHGKHGEANYSARQAINPNQSQSIQFLSWKKEESQFTSLSHLEQLDVCLKKHSTPLNQILGHLYICIWLPILLPISFHLMNLQYSHEITQKCPQLFVNLASSSGAKSLPRWLKVMKSKLAGSATTLQNTEGQCIMWC